MRAGLGSGPLVALWRPPKKNHKMGGGEFGRFTGPFYATQLIPAEVAHLTGRDREIVAAFKAGRFILGADIVEDLSCIERCCAKYSQCDLADASIIAASERFPRLQVITVDRKHFGMYR